MVMEVVPLRVGATLVGPPVMHWTIKKNAVFTDAMRTSPLMPVGGPIVTGSTLATPVLLNGIPSETKWAWDLPDTGFLFAGDVLHYYIEASDTDGLTVQSSQVPTDLTGYGDFSHPLAYSSTFTIKALPTIKADLSQPGILFWNDYANNGGENEWYGALDNMGLLWGRDYDIYYTQGPTSGVGNGLGAAASAITLADYTDMLYTAGNYSAYTMANGDWVGDPSPDIDTVINWLNQGNKDLYMTGDGVVTDLAHPDNLIGNTFIEQYMGLQYFDENVRDNIGNQSTPKVEVLAGNGVIANVAQYVAYGGCPVINAFDAVQTLPGSEALCRFMKTDGSTYNAFSAATLFELANGSRVVSMPYDFMYIYDDLKAPAPVTSRGLILKDILGFFNVDSTGDISAVPAAERFAVKNYPNPFNPVTKIEYMAPKAGHMTLKVFNVRGELVRTLVDGVVPAGLGFTNWDGTSDSGSSVSSGVYFYEARFGGDVEVQKMTLVK
jgi:hypothetical protein